jgi:peptide-N4-(N-acetyl-beta-glucosaminyl)asparagine amidase
MLCLRACGVRSRYIYDVTDHVWCEVFDDFLEEWIHVDCCENSWNQPLLYSEGWGKSLSYVIAISDDTVADVSLRYVRYSEEWIKRRNKMAEQVLEEVS